MIKYSEPSPASVQLSMDRRDYERILMLFGLAAGTARRAGDPQLKWDLIRLLNDMNRTNPNYTPYELPERHAPRT